MGGLMSEIHENETTSPKKASLSRLLIFILLVAGLFIVVRVFNLQEYFREDRLRQFIAAWGMWGPLIYLLVWTIAPSLFLPGLPITIAGGILFGPVWGIIYTAFGATAGASLAFLVARYLARDWVGAKLSGSKLARLDEKVAQQGWKIVAFTRLIPFIPFFLLNYAFGLTRISFWPYAIATFFGMLPWTIAFILVSSNLLALIRGEVTIWLIIGIILVVLVSLLPLIFKQIKARRGESEEL
jgi:uncharacterized membrane protein YdjX (TVP38/TMEM64 family)